MATLQTEPVRNPAFSASQEPRSAMEQLQVNSHMLQEASTAVEPEEASTVVEPESSALTELELDAQPKLADQAYADARAQSVGPHSTRAQTSIAAHSAAMLNAQVCSSCSFCAKLW